MNFGILILTVMTLASSAFAGPRCQFLSYFGNASDYVKQHPGQFPPELMPTPMITTKQWNEAEKKAGLMTLVGSKDLGEVGKLTVGYSVYTTSGDERTINISIQKQGVIQQIISAQAYPDHNGIVNVSFNNKALKDLNVKVKCKGLELNNPLPDVDYESPEFTNSDPLFFVKD